MLSETASNMYHSLGIAEHDVLGRICFGLTGPGAVVTDQEAGWVVHRLAELMSWPYLTTETLREFKATHG